jgi:hypothetical protein
VRARVFGRVGDDGLIPLTKPVFTQLEFGKKKTTSVLGAMMNNQ